MSTKSEIIRIGDELIRDKGINAFSYADISKILGIKNASIHYYFPTKTDLCLAVIDAHQKQLQSLIETNAEDTPIQKLEAFMSIYAATQAEQKICLVGALTTDLHTVEEPIKTAMEQFAGMLLSWVTAIIEEGVNKNAFYCNIPARVKAMLIITNMLAALQFTRLTHAEDFYIIQQTIIKEITTEI